MRIAGLVVGVRVRNTQNGRMGIATLDDRSGRAEIVLFNDDFNTYRDRLEPDTLLVAEGTVALDDYAGGIRMRARAVYTLDEARAQWARALHLCLEGVRAEQVQNLRGLMEEHRNGQCRVHLCYRRDGLEAELSLPEGWAIRPDERLLRNLQQTLGPGCEAQVLYGR